MASQRSFAVAAEELLVFRRIRVSASTVRLHAQAVGESIGHEWNQLADQVRMKVAPGSGMTPRRLFKSMDAAKCHVGGEWRDAKLAAAYERSESAVVTRALYFASLECSKDFGVKAAALAHYAGGDACEDRQVIGDGAEWIWNETTKHDPTAVQTLDFYHLTEHLDEFANARFGERTASGRAWVTRQKGLLLSDDLASVLQDISTWHPTKAEDKTIRRKTLAYINQHSGRMAYGTLRAHGYDIGSGLIESGCKSVIKARMGGAGMRWEEPGAAAMLHLSAFWRSDRKKKFFDYT
jgi:hypothetical protein